MSWRRGPDPGIGRWRAAGCAASLEGLDDDHAATATRAWRAMVLHEAGTAGGRVCVVMLYRGIDRRRGHGDQFSGARDIGLAGGAGEQPVVSDAVEPLGQDVEQEAPDELVGRQRHGAKPRLAVAAVIFVTEGDAALIEAEQAAVRDGDAVSVASEIGGAAWARCRAVA